MNIIRDKIDALEELLNDHGLAEGLRRLSIELGGLAAYAGMTDGVSDAIRDELLWTAGLVRQTRALTTTDAAATVGTGTTKKSGRLHFLGALLDRIQDMSAAEPMTGTDVLLDSLSVVLPWVGGTTSLEGATASHRGSLAVAEARIEEILWHSFAQDGGSVTGDGAWAKVEEKRATVERCSELVANTEDPKACAATLLLLYLTMVVAALRRLRELAAPA